MTLREFLDIKETTIVENQAKIKQLEEAGTEAKVQIAQQKLKYDKQLDDLRGKILQLQTTIDANNAKLEASKHSLSNEKAHRHAFQKLNTDASGQNSTSGGVTTTHTGSAKNNSRSINSMSRTMSKQQIIAASGASSANRNSGSQISFMNGGG